MSVNVENDRDYRFNDIEVDPRFKVCEFEMKLTFAVWIAYMVVSIGLCYYFGLGDPADYQYLWGVPLWMALGVWVTSAVFFLIVIFISIFVFQNMDISK